MLSDHQFKEKHYFNDKKNLYKQQIVTFKKLEPEKVC